MISLRQLKISRITAQSQEFCKLISLHTARLSPAGLRGAIIIIRGPEWLATAPLGTGIVTLEEHTPFGRCTDAVGDLDLFCQLCSPILSITVFATVCTYNFKSGLPLDAGTS